MTKQYPERALLVDGDDLIQMLVKQYLSAVGNEQIVVCRNGAEAMHAIETAIEPFDILLMDWKLKNPTGPQLFREFKIRPQTASLPIILISGFITRQDIQIVKVFKGTNFVVKPFTEEVFLGVVGKSFPGVIQCLKTGKPPKKKQAPPVEDQSSLYPPNQGLNDDDILYDDNFADEGFKEQSQEIGADWGENQLGNFTQDGQSPGPPTSSDNPYSQQVPLSEDWGQIQNPNGQGSAFGSSGQSQQNVHQTPPGQQPGWKPPPAPIGGMSSLSEDGDIIHMKGSGKPKSDGSNHLKSQKLGGHGVEVDKGAGRRGRGNEVHGGQNPDGSFSARQHGPAKGGGLDPQVHGGDSDFSDFEARQEKATGRDWREQEHGPAEGVDHSGDRQRFAGDDDQRRWNEQPRGDGQQRPTAPDLHRERNDSDWGGSDNFGKSSGSNPWADLENEPPEAQANNHHASQGNHSVPGRQPLVDHGPGPEGGTNPYVDSGQGSDAARPPFVEEGDQGERNPYLDPSSGQNQSRQPMVDQGPGDRAGGNPYLDEGQSNSDAWKRGSKEVGPQPKDDQNPYERSRPYDPNPLSSDMTNDSDMFQPPNPSGIGYDPTGEAGSSLGWQQENAPGPREQDSQPARRDLSQRNEAMTDFQQQARSANPAENNQARQKEGRQNPYHPTNENKNQVGDGWMTQENPGPPDGAPLASATGAGVNEGGAGDFQYHHQMDGVIADSEPERIREADKNAQGGMGAPVYPGAVIPEMGGEGLDDSGADIESQPVDPSQRKPFAEHSNLADERPGEKSYGEGQTKTSALRDNQTPKEARDNSDSSSGIDHGLDNLLDEDVSRPSESNDESKLGAVEGKKKETTKKKVKSANKNLQSRRLGIESVLVVDKDPSLLGILKKYLTDIGVAQVDAGSDGMAAWELAQKNSYDVIMFDWKMDGISGLALYNRIRGNARLARTPVIVISGFIHKQDFRILQETRRTRFMEKPFQVSSLDKLIIELFAMIDSDEKTKATVASLLDEAIEDEIPVMEFLGDILQRVPNAFYFLSAAGKYLFTKEMYEDAEKVLRMAFRVKPKSVEVLTLLGKIYHHLNRPEDAYKILAKAEGLSPDNIERLCLLGEVGLTLQDPDKARGYFKHALDIDEENPVARAGMTISDNMQHHIDEHGADEPLTAKFSSSLNIIGITMVRNKEYQKGVEQYMAAMCFLRDRESLAKVKFNLGLAYLRARKFPQAGNWLKNALKTDPTFKKPQEFLKYIEENFPGEMERPAGGDGEPDYSDYRKKAG